jgi:hypothetical protein
MAKRNANRKGKRPSRKYRKRNYRRRKINPANTHLPLGQSQVVKHRYLETFQLTTTLGVRAAYTFAVNAMYDPNITGSGHKPIGFTQMSAIFGRYTVVGAKCNLKFWSRDLDETMAIGLYLSEDPTPATDPSTLIENGAMIYKIVPVIASDSSNQQVVNLSTKLSIKKFCRVKNVEDYNTLGVDYTSNPSRLVYCHVIMWQPDGSATNAAGSCYFQMEQIALWTKPRTLSQS